MTSKKCLNLGAGNDIRDNCMNVDIRQLGGIDAQVDVRSLPFQNEVFDSVIAQDCIEHIRYREVDRFLHECYRVLRPEGELFVRTPNFQWIVDNLEFHYENPVRLQRKLYGGHTYPRREDEDYPENTHLCIFTPGLIENHLADAGFENIRTRTDLPNPNHWNLGAYAQKSRE